MRTPFASLLLLVACSSPAAPVAATAPVVEASAPAPAPLAAPRPAPGVDLPDAVPLPVRGAAPSHRAGGGAPATVALASDRALVRADVPVPPRGGAVAFQLPDERPAWIAAIPDTVQLPAVAYGDGRIYISGGFESTTFYALDATTGHIEWATTNLEDNGPTAAVYDDDRVLFNTESCTLFALDAKTGKRLWHRYLGDPTLSQIAVADGLVYASHPAPEGQQLTAYHVTTGAAVWTRTITTELLSAPVIAGDAVYVSTVGGMTFRFARATGAVRWAKPLHATAAPWVVGNALYVTRRHGAGEQQVIVSAETGAVAEQHHETAVADDVPADTRDWKAVWAFEGSRPVVDRGIRYEAMGGEIHATDAESGAPRWQRTAPDARDARDAPETRGAKRAFGSVALAGSEVVVAMRDGKLFGLDVDTGYTQWSYDLGHRVIAEPIVAKGWVYVTTADGYVIGLHIADATLDGWHMFGGNPQHDGPVVAPHVETAAGAT